MSANGNSRADLFGTTSNKSYAPHPVWKNSALNPVRFAPLGSNRQASRRAGARLWHNARRFDRQTREKGKHGGRIGQVGLRVLYVMIFDFIDHATGRLDPSYETLARIANVSVRSVARAIQRLKAAGVLNWERRVYAKPTENPRSGWRMAQDTNAYAILPDTQWKGFHPPPDAPKPEPGTWGDHPPMREGATADVLRAGGSIDGFSAEAIAADWDTSAIGRAMQAAGRMIRDRKRNP